MTTPPLGRAVFLSDEGRGGLLLRGGGELEDGAETGFVRECERESARCRSIAVQGRGDEVAGAGLCLIFETKPVELETTREVFHGLVEGTVAVEVPVHVGLMFLDAERREAFRLLRGERDLARKVFHRERLVEPEVADDLRRDFAGASGCAVDERADSGAEDAYLSLYVISCVITATFLFREWAPQLVGGKGKSCRIA